MTNEELIKEIAEMESRSVITKNDFNDKLDEINAQPEELCQRCIYFLTWKNKFGKE